MIFFTLILRRRGAPIASALEGMKFVPVVVCCRRTRSRWAGSKPQPPRILKVAFWVDPGLEGPKAGGGAAGRRPCGWTGGGQRPPHASATPNNYPPDDFTDLGLRFAAK